MRAFRDLPIRRKLMIVVLVTTGAALLAAHGVLLALDIARFRTQMKEELLAIGSILAENAVAAVAFKDAGDAASTLSALRARPEIVAAAIFVEPGPVLLAAHPAAEAVRDLAPRTTSVAADFDENGLTVVQPVVVGGASAGVVVLRSDLRRLQQRVRTLALTTLAVLAGAFGVAVLVSGVAQRAITRPILDVAGTAAAVALRRDYSLRARKAGADELGQLVDVFNGMLARIEAHDAELRRSRDELEARVAERTAELARRNEELARSNRELDDFAYIASHDLKEPLRGLHNYATFLLEDCGDLVDRESRARLETMTRLTRRMDELLDTLLYYSRVGRLDLAIGDVDLQQMITGVIDSLHISLEEQQVEVRIPRPLPTVRCDAARIGEVFRNLVANAVKFNDKEQKWIEIGALAPDAARRTRPADRPPLGRATQAVIYVRDNGIGIPDRHFDAIFRIFKRLHARDRFGGGHGAGLTIVKKIVERHDGEVWVESTVGEGTTFYVAL